jgi:hypothetical protein
MQRMTPFRREGSRNIQLTQLVLASTVALTLYLYALPVSARLYSYVNEEGDYVVSQKRPKNVEEYAILTDEGEFIRLVKRKRDDVPITHWRPWYMPKEPDPINPVEPGLEQRTPEVLIEEVDEPEPN